jgi:hypothetical protein
MQRRNILIIAASIVSGSVAASQAQIYEGFDYAPGTINADGGVGFSDSWGGLDEFGEPVAGLATDNIVAGLSYSNGRPLVVKGNGYRPNGFQGITRTLANPVSGDPSLEGNGATVWMSYLYESNIGATDASLVSLTRGGPFFVDSAPRLQLAAPRTSTFDNNFARAAIWDQFGDRAINSTALLDKPGVNLLLLQYVPDASEPGVNTGTLRAWLNPLLDGTEPAPETSFGLIANTTEGLRAFDTLRIFSFSGNLAEQKPTFDEIRVGSTFAEAVRQAQPGDIDADGAVNFSDLLTLAQNYDQPAQNGWASGDFDFDGVVAFSDLLALAQNYGTTGLMAGIGSPQFGADWNLARAVVPEPATAALAVLASGLLLTRRRA